MTVNRQVVLLEQPKGALEESHYEMREAPAPEPGDGEVLVRTLLISIDAANRAWMQGATYRKEMTGGSVMDGYGVAQVVESKADGVAEGDIVACEVGWQDYSVHLARRVVKLPNDYRPLSHFISVLGIAGLTAWHGLMKIGQPKEGETVLVSAAAGSVGQYVGQIAKAKGCTVIGIAGGPEKCAFVTDELGFDACIDYKNEHVRKRIAELAPDGVDIYFDNVGAEILEAALFNMALHGRVVCCGAISQYDTTEISSPRGLPGLIVFKRLRMEGFIVTDFYGENDAAIADLSAMHAAGQIKVVEDVLEGLEQAPKGLIGLLAGDNLGKRMIRVAPDPA